MNLYKNGNYIVVYQDNPDGNIFLKKRALRVGEELVADFPDSIDLKISNRCGFGCRYCHENSTKIGNIFDFNKTVEILAQLPKEPIEIAVGGGDIFESPNQTLKLLKWLIKNEYRPRITINYKDLTKDWGDKLAKIYTVLENVNSIGISIDNLDNIIWTNSIYGNDILDNVAVTLPITTTKVYHVILGVFPAEQLLQLYEKGGEHILILGYKQWGRAKNDPLPTNEIKKTREVLKDIINSGKFNYDLVLGFDNLAIEQLRLKEIIPETMFENLYMGDEGKHSMYIDAVKGEFARTSRSPERVSWNNIGLIEYFKQL